MVPFYFKILLLSYKILCIGERVIQLEFHIGEPTYLLISEKSLINL